MILLDTHVILFDALSPDRLSRPATQALEQGFEWASLACSDISLWEISMLLKKGRLQVDTADPAGFIGDLLTARLIRVLPITPEIAWNSQFLDFAHADPADRLIAATAHHFGAPLVTADAHLRQLSFLSLIW